MSPRYSICLQFFHLLSLLCICALQQTQSFPLSAGHGLKSAKVNQSQSRRAFSLLKLVSTDFETSVTSRSSSILDKIKCGCFKNGLMLRF